MTRLTPVEPRMKWQELHGHECECQQCRDCEPEHFAWGLVNGAILSFVLWAAGAWLLLGIFD